MACCVVHGALFRLLARHDDDHNYCKDNHEDAQHAAHLVPALFLRTTHTAHGTIR